MTIRERKVLSKDETLQIFNATIDVMRDTFLKANENFDYDIVTMMEAFTQGADSASIIVRSMDAGAIRVGLLKDLHKEIDSLADAIINDPDMGGLPYEKIAELSELRKASEERNAQNNN